MEKNMSKKTQPVQTISQDSPLAKKPLVSINDIKFDGKIVILNPHTVQGGKTFTLKENDYAIKRFYGIDPQKYNLDSANQDFSAVFSEAEEHPLSEIRNVFNLIAKQDFKFGLLDFPASSVLDCFAATSKRREQNLASYKEFFPFVESCNILPIFDLLLATDVQKTVETLDMFHEIIEQIKPKYPVILSLVSLEGAWWGSNEAESVDVIRNQYFTSGPAYDRIQAMEKSGLFKIIYRKQHVNIDNFKVAFKFHSIETIEKETTLDAMDRRTATLLRKDAVEAFKPIVDFLASYDFSYTNDTEEIDY